MSADDDFIIEIILLININSHNKGVLESKNYNDISKFSNIIFENYSDAYSQEEEKDYFGFKFMLLSVNKKYPQILGIRVQLKY